MPLLVLPLLRLPKDLMEHAPLLVSIRFKLPNEFIVRIEEVRLPMAMVLQWLVKVNELGSDGDAIAVL